jgi:hypothetical protein
MARGSRTDLSAALKTLKRLQEKHNGVVETFHTCFLKKSRCPAAKTPTATAVERKYDPQETGAGHISTPTTPVAKTLKPSGAAKLLAEYLLAHFR